MSGAAYFEIFALVLDRLEARGIAHMVVGSVASMIYGEPRLTHDIDLVVELDPADTSPSSRGARPGSRRPRT